MSGRWLQGLLVGAGCGSNSENSPMTISLRLLDLQMSFGKTETLILPLLTNSKTMTMESSSEVAVNLQSNPAVSSTTK
jgi:hypothetical protein